MVFVYILRCADETCYVGMTTDIKNRYREHVGGSVLYTKNRQPLKLIWCGIFRNKFIAAKFEQYLKTSSGKAFTNKRLI
ncbi:GIY-YIG nuclease family protein [Candidatus Falkowbacteria bacterium]|nr:GIY-YIG nuclease family protein [Candidatus Falkowbacteria bacterium]